MKKYHIEYASPHIKLRAILGTILCFLPIWQLLDPEEVDLGLVTVLVKIALCAIFAVLAVSYC